MASKREWIETPGVGMAGLPGRWLWVEDGVLGHRAALAAGVSPAAALDDYAAGYDAGEDAGEIEVRWHLYDDGGEIDRGWHTFVTGAPAGA